MTRHEAGHEGSVFRLLHRGTAGLPRPFPCITTREGENHRAHLQQNKTSSLLRGRACLRPQLLRWVAGVLR